MIHQVTECQNCRCLVANHQISDEFLHNPKLGRHFLLLHVSCVVDVNPFIVLVFRVIRRKLFQVVFQFLSCFFGFGTLRLQVKDSDNLEKSVCRCL